MSPSLAPGHGVDLVHDDPLQRAEVLPCPRPEDQEEGLGGGDQDLAGLSLLALPGGGRGIAGPDVHSGHLEPLTQALGDPCDSGDGRPEVPLDVVDEGLERGHVEHADARLRARWAASQTVDGVEEGREGLSAARGRREEGVVTLGDGPPTGGLDRSGLGERLCEPAPRGRSEMIHGTHWVGLPSTRVRARCVAVPITGSTPIAWYARVIPGSPTPAPSRL